MSDEVLSHGSPKVGMRENAAAGAFANARAIGDPWYGAAPHLIYKIQPKKLSSFIVHNCSTAKAKDDRDDTKRNLSFVNFIYLSILNTMSECVLDPSDPLGVALGELS